MSRTRFASHVELEEGVLLSVEGISKGPKKPPAQPPQWMARFLPGVQWSVAGRDDDSEDFEDDDLMEQESEGKRAGALREVSFQLAPGEGLGLLGDTNATQTLLMLVAGLYPPSTGRVAVRGRIAPVFRFSQLNFSNGTGKSSLKVISRFMHWPPDFLRKRWDEIVDFAHLDEVDEFGFPPKSVEYEEARTKRLFLSSVMHLDASVYLVFKAFAGSDSAMAERCSDVLEQRQREGCAIVQNGVEPEHVARLCRDAILFDEGTEVFRGRLGAVATFMADQHEREQQKHQQRLPVRALLVDQDGEVPTFGDEGGTLEIELDVFKTLAVWLSLRFADSGGHEHVKVDRLEPLDVTPGIYRVGIKVPRGLLAEGVYSATLVATGRPAEGEEGPPPSRELLSFEVASESDSQSGPVFGVVPDGDKQGAYARDVEWRVHRVET
jgi:ABC-type polysaccharide/polyol phosphate transport system ATPase subunit